MGGGYDFGDQSILGAELKHNLEITGMQHIVSASGTNVGLILLPLKIFFRHFKVFSCLRLLINLLIIWSYLIMVGGQPPIFRAVLMATYKLACEFNQRQYSPGFALILSATMMLLFRFSYLKELSFQLSFAASAGIIFLLPLMNKLQRYNLMAELDSLSPTKNFKFKKSVLNLWTDAFYCTLAAQLVIAPVLLFHDLPISWLGLWANPMLLWLVPLITWVSLVVLILSVVVDRGIWLGWLGLNLAQKSLSVLINVFTSLLDFFGQWDVGLIHLPRSGWLIVSWWSLLFLWWLNNRSRRPC